MRRALPAAASATPDMSRRLATALAATLTILVVAGAAIVPAAGAGSHPRLLPDLVTLRVGQGDLILKRSGKKLLLRLSNVIGNRGPGPLEIRPSGAPSDCDGDGNPANDRATYQRIFRDSNADHAFDRDQDMESNDRLFGCERFHPPHHHWHLLDFSRFKLVRERTGRTVVRSTKISFCVIDTDHPFAGLPGSPPRGYYPAGSADCDRDSIDGLSVGWSDIYHYSLPGQKLNVTGLRHGRYCLVSTADPNNLLRESDNSNNAHRARIALHPGKRKVKRLPGRCRSR
jgi:Lysyl oxidase